MPAGDKIRLILDNHLAHTSRETQEYFNIVPGRFEFVFNNIVIEDIHMKKILPINYNPYIRTYTYFGYHQAIISASNNVPQNINDEVASVYIKDYNLYTWRIDNEEINYQINPNNILKFYGNKWNTNMNVAFSRLCNIDDEIDVCIQKQLNSNVWASVVVFLTDGHRKCMTNNNISYEIQMGNYSKDGLYYKIGSMSHIVLLPNPSLPLKMHLIRTGDEVKLIYNDVNQIIQEIVIHNNESKYSFERIGFAVNLGCNAYYEWLFSNFINFSVNIESILPIDFLWNNHKNWNTHTNDYFIDYNMETEHHIHTLGFSILEYIKRMVNLNRYVETDINDNIHLNISDDYGKFFHQNLIYGYDDLEENLYLLYYENGKVHNTAMTYMDFLSERNALSDRKLYVYKYDPGYEVYQLAPKFILQVYKEFKNSQNISYYEPRYNNSFYFGLKALNSLLSDKGFAKLISDIRISHLLYEHSICNRDRFEYLFYKKIIDESFYQCLSNVANKGCDTALILRNLILKKHFGGKVEEVAIKKHITQLIDIETQIADLVVCKFDGDISLPEY